MEHLLFAISDPEIWRQFHKNSKSLVTLVCSCTPLQIWYQAQATCMQSFDFQ